MRMIILWLLVLAGVIYAGVSYLSRSGTESQTRIEPHVQPATGSGKNLSPASTPVAAAEPEAVYQQVHRALLAGDLDEALKHSPTAQRAEMDKLSSAEREMTLKAMTMLLPDTYTITRTTINPDGNSGTLIAAGETEFLGSKQHLTGTIAIIQESGLWKIAKINWRSQK